jgi:hypothetical protein
MAKVKARFRTRTKNYYYEDKYKTATFYFDELPISDFQPLCRWVDMGKLKELLTKQINEKHPDTINNLLSFQIIQ